MLLVDKVSAGNLIYTASKAALNMSIRVMALEEAPKGVRINGVMPGAVETEMLQQFAQRNQ